MVQKISAQFDQSIEMCRCSIVYDYWETDLEQKSARADRFFFSWNDHEFAFREKNYKYLTQFGKDDGFGTFYIKFTPFIEDIDFRVQIIETVVGTQLHLM